MKYKRSKDLFDLVAGPNHQLAKKTTSQDPPLKDDQIEKIIKKINELDIKNFVQTNLSIEFDSMEQKWKVKRAGTVETPTYISATLSTSLKMFYDNNLWQSENKNKYSGGSE